MLRASILLSAFFFATAAFAAPRSIADCEAIQAADAYNRCLASFGPVRGGGGRYYGPSTSEPTQARMRHGRRYTSEANFQRSRPGRMRMEFTPGH